VWENCIILIREQLPGAYIFLAAKRALIENLFMRTPFLIVISLFSIQRLNKQRKKENPFTQIKSSFSRVNLFVCRHGNENKQVARER